MDLQFGAIYSGFLGSADQVDTVARFFNTFKKSDTAVIVDPVMGDHGTAYRTCTPELCRGMRVLAENADVITPNLTEAALLLDRPYEEIRADRRLRGGSPVKCGWTAVCGAHRLLFGAGTDRSPVL